MHRHQQGISYWGVVLVVGLFGLTIKVGAAVGPMYLDNMTITKVVSNTVSNPENRDISPTDFKNAMQKGLEMNNITTRQIENLVQFGRDNEGYVVDVKYEDRQNLIGNLDVVVHFAKRYSVGNPDGVDIPPEEQAK